MTTLRTARDSDLSSIEQLLREASLPVDGVRDAVSGFVVAEDRSRIVAVGGLERCGDDALLRSLVVVPSARGSGIGHRLVAQLLEGARTAGITRLWLLTETAEEFFRRFGFRRVERDRVPDAVRATDEFSHACPASATAMARRVLPFRILVLCTANSARSQLAEALFRHRGAGLVESASAGTHPGAGPHPMAIETLRRLGIDWRDRQSKSIDAVGTDWDLVITVCDDARESCPVLPGHATLHWGMPDPAAVGDPAMRQAAFDAVAEEFERRIARLLALPLAVMTSREVAEFGDLRSEI